MSKKIYLSSPHLGLSELKFVEEFGNINNAIEREKQIKGWTRKKKEALIERDFDKLVRYAKCHHGSTSSP